jgi:hypothetical protein
VLDDDHPGAGRDDQPFGREQAVGDVARILVQQRDRRHQLAKQAQRRVQIDLETALGGDAQHVGEPDALDVVGDNRQARRVPVDAAHARIVGVPEIREASRALTQRELERRYRQELRPHPEDLEQIACGRVDCDDAVAESVAEKRRFGLVGGRGHGCHI